MSKRPLRPRSLSSVRVPATEAAKNFGRLVDRVREERATFIIERGGNAVAQIAPVARAPFAMAEFKALVSDVAPVDEAYLRAVERAIERHNRLRVRRNPWER